MMEMLLEQHTVHGRFLHNILFFDERVAAKRFYISVDKHKTYFMN